MYKVRMKSNSGSVLYAAASGHPSDWVTENIPEPEAVLETEAGAIALAILVVAKGYATPRIVTVV